MWKYGPLLIPAHGKTNNFLVNYYGPPSGYKLANTDYPPWNTFPRFSLYQIIDTKELSDNQYVSPEDDYHVHIGSKEYFEILFDNNKFTEIDSKINPVDFLNFIDTKKYSDRIKEAQSKTGLKDAIRVAYGKSYEKKL